MPTLIDYLLGAGLGVIGVLIGAGYEWWAERRQNRKSQ